MIPYTRHTITPEDEAAVLRVLRSGYLTQGPEVEAFEHELAQLAGARYAMAVSSGTAALSLLLSVRDAVSLVPAISFVATANVVDPAHLRFADCDPETGLALQRCDLGVTLGGQPVGAPIVDACHGPLAHLGSEATVFSFHPAKHVAAGEGGAIVTNDASLADVVRLKRAHGRQGTAMIAMGWNYRLDEMSAALARSQLTRYHAGVKERRRLAAVYDEAFALHPEIAPVPHSAESARHLYQVLLPAAKRGQVQAMLRARGIGTAIHYPPIPSQPYYQAMGYTMDGYTMDAFAGAEQHAARTLSLPLFPGLTVEDQRRVITALLEVM